MDIRVTGLWRYPVKGLGGEPLGAIEPSPSGGIAGDRRFALAHDTSAFDPAAPVWKPKAEFLQLARDPGMAPLSTRWDAAADTLTLVRDYGRGERVTARPETDDGRASLEEFIASAAAPQRRAGGRLVRAEGTILSDTGRPFVSIISAATVRAISQAAGLALDPRRFRGNIVIDGAEAWAEFDWLGQGLRVGSALLRPAERIGRCAATNVDPDTGVLDIDLPRFLRDRFGHHQCGVYAEVVEAGRIALGDSVRY
ncbi:MAG TPA: MOSC domain-containing protein [Stellaceae bacterium]|nr:MOSC domain-containing protein [Stellaceae bacterium]